MPETQTLHVHRLEGCRPQPLANYLKALGILRLVAEQADPSARGWWKDDVFHLVTSLERERLQNFFLHDFVPSPILSPWLKGSGFYQSDDPGLEPLARSTAPRFENYRTGIARSRELLQEIEHADAVIRAAKARTKTDSSFQTGQQRETLRNSALTEMCRRTVETEIATLRAEADDETLSDAVRKRIEKLGEETATLDLLASEPGTDPETGADIRPDRQASNRLKQSAGYKRLLKVAGGEFSRLKARLITDCKKAWRGSLSDWFSVAVVIDDDASPKWPSLLGTGGNDGNLDFTNNLMQRLGDLFDLDTGSPVAVASPLLELCLFNELSNTLSDEPIGQFLPNSTGGPNCGSGFSGSVGVNHWDYVLMLEGTLLFRAGISRRCSANALPQAAAPFAVRSSGFGYGSSGKPDEGARGEQWMPVWSRPSRLEEVEELFLHARSQTGRKTVERGTEMARALNRLGTARGIRSFERYGYIERNGLSNLAVPLGSYRVSARQNQGLLDEVSVWMERLRQIAAGKNLPLSMERCYRACEEAVLRCTKKPDGHSFLELLIAMAAAEDQLVRNPGFAAASFARPVPGLSHQWADLVFADGRKDPEVRLGFALAAQTGPLKSGQRAMSVRHHWVPLDGNRFATGESGLASGPTQSASGQPLESALVSVGQRRIIAMSAGATDGWLPLRLTRNRYGAPLNSILAFLNCRVRDSRILSIARGLMAVNLFRSDQVFRREKNSGELRMPLGGLATYGVLRLAMGGGSSQWHRKEQRCRNRPVRVGGEKEIEITCNPAIFNRLQGGDLNAAVALAVHKLGIAGLRPRIRVSMGDSRMARRLAASLAFGISDSNMSRLACGLTDPRLPPRDDLPDETST